MALFSTRTLAAAVAAVFLAASARSQPLRFTRAPAGETQLIRGQRVPATIKIDPPLAHPFRLEQDSAGVRVIVPPATPPGEYRVTFADSTEVALTVEPLAVPKAATGRVPVVLLNGFQVICGNRASTVTASSDTFGQLAFQLLSDGAPVLFFNNCSYGDDVPLEELAAQLAVFLNGLKFSDGSPVTQVDLMAHSMGGLIARTYLAGLRRDGSLVPPADPKVRKLMLVATPNFGSFQAAKIARNQTVSILPASAFLRSLAEWNQRQDDLRGVDALAVVGVAGFHYGTGAGMDDGVVASSSASLGFARPDERTRIVNYCHITPGPLTFLGMDCTARRGIVDVDSDAHFTSRIIRSFLGDTEEWKTLGNPPSRDPVLETSGGVYVDAQTAGGLWVADLTEMSFGNVPLSPGGIAGTTFYRDFVKGTATFIGARKNLGSVSCGPFVMVKGYYRGVNCKELPSISAVTPLLSTTQARVVPSGGNVVLTGAGFGQPCNTCVVRLYPGGIPLETSSWSATAISVALPPISGLLQLALEATTGRDTINIMAAAPASSVRVASFFNAASGVGGAVVPGEILTIVGSGLGPATGVSFTVNNAGKVETSLAGVRVMFGDFAAPILYASSAQINVIVPYEVAGQTQVTVLITYAGSGSAMPVAVANAVPGIFTSNFSGTGQAVAANQDGSLNTPFTPATRGSFVTLYLTGGGQTNPPGATGSVNGNVLKRLTEEVQASVGGVPAVVAFAGAAPGLVDGVIQLNLQLSLFTPPGSSQSVIVNVGGVSSASGVTLAVQ